MGLTHTVCSIPEKVPMSPATAVERTAQVAIQMTDQMARFTRIMNTWVQEAPRTLAEIEQQLLPLLKEVGNTLLATLASLAAPPSSPCSCGHQTRYLRYRAAPRFSPAPR